MNRPSSWRRLTSRSLRSRIDAAQVGEAVALFIVLGLAAYLRFARLAETPGWYSDEGTIAEIAQNLALGEVRYLAIERSTLLAARLPLMPWLLSLLIGGAQTALLTLREMTAALGLLSTLLLYLLVRTSLGPSARANALLSAALFAIYPLAVFYSRLGFSYNLLTPLVLTATAGFWHYLNGSRRGGLMVAALAIGVGAITDLMMVSLAAPFVSVALARRKGDLLWGVPLLAMPFAAFAATMLLRDPAAFLFDMRFILGRLGAVAWWAQIPLITYNLGTLALTDPWWVPAIIGLLLIRQPRWRLLLLAVLFLPLILLGRSSGLAGIRRYSISPLFPFIALGVAQLLVVGFPWMLRFVRQALVELLGRVQWLSRSATGRWTRQRLVAMGSAGAGFLLALTPLLISTFDLFSQVRADFRPENSWAYLPPGEAAAAAAVVNELASPADLVLASPALAWALTPRAVDFQQALAYAGQASIDYPVNVPRDRFAYEAGIERASYAVVDRIWLEWGAVHIDGAAKMLEQIEGWSKIWQRGEITVYARDGR